MRLVGAMLLACVMLLLAGWSAAAGEKGNAEKIIGKWEATKGEVPLGSIIEFTKDGKARITIKVEGKEVKEQGTYKVEGDKLTTTLKAGDNEHTETVTIKTLNTTTLAIEDKKGKVAEFKRIKG